MVAMTDLAKRHMGLKIAAGRLAGVFVALSVPIALYSPKAMAPLFVIVACLLLAASYPWRRVRWNGLAGAMVAFAVFSAISVTWSPDPSDSVKTFLPFVVTVGAGYFVIAQAFGIDIRLRNILYTALIVGGALAYGLLVEEYVSGNSFQQFAYSLVGKSVNDRFALNLMKPGLIVGALYLWPWALAVHSRYGARTAIVAGACGMGAILLHVFDTTIVALVAGILLSAITVVLGRRHLRIIAAGFVVLVLAIPLLISALPDPTQPGASRLAFLSNSAIHRVAIWTVANRLIHERPILGHGFESARMQFNSSTKAEQVMLPDVPERSFTVVSEPIPLHPHNSILQIWLETGLAGALCLAAFLAYLTRLAADSAADTAQRIAAFGLIGTAFCVSNISFGAWQSWWIATLLLMGALLSLMLEPTASD